MTALAILLNKRITIQSPATGQDAYGAPATGWVDVATVWASVADLSGREFLAAASTQSAVQTKIIIRHRDGIAANMRVLHGSTPYNIEAVLGQDNRTLMLMCSRGVVQ